jgi:hypothetical protein
MSDKHKHAGVFIRMPDDLIKKLEVEAESRMVSKTWLASRLVIEGLRNLKPVEAPWLTDTPPKPPVYRGIIPDPCPVSADGKHDLVEGACAYCSFQVKLPNPNYCPQDPEGMHYYQENGVCMYCGAQDSI